MKQRGEGIQVFVEKRRNGVSWNLLTSNPYEGKQMINLDSLQMCYSHIIKQKSKIQAAVYNYKFRQQILQQT